MSTDQAGLEGGQPHSGCSILTIASSLATARTFVSRVQSLTSTSSLAASDKSSELELLPLKGIPYTLVNRYYTANVSFVPYEMKIVSPALFSVASSSDFKPPPALIFTWVDGEPYEKHVEELSRLMASREYEPEVCLAVRLPKPEASGDSSNLGSVAEGEEEDNADIDSTLMGFGFEYVDATVEAAPRSAPRSEASDDIPRLPRVIDALSTIMWPSMESASSSKGQDASQPSARRLAERDALMEELFAVSEISGISAGDNRARLAPETHHGNESDDDFSAYDFDAGTGTSFSVSANAEAWLKGSGSGSGFSKEIASDIVNSPVEMASDASQFPIDSSAGKVSIGFEDDFTVFVSAPPPSSENPSITSHFDDEDGTSRLAPSSALGAGRTVYRSLGSVSDLGVDDDEDWNRYQSLDDEREGTSVGIPEPGVDDLDDGWADEDGMPTKEEIVATAAKIFGAVPPGSTKSAAGEGAPQEAPSDSKSQGETGKGTSARAAPSSSHGEIDSDDELFAGSGGDIDITRIFHGLREMRSEIAAVEDEAERRRMAARVALGFVYGMDLDIPGDKSGGTK